MWRSIRGIVAGEALAALTRVLIGSAELRPHGHEEVLAHKAAGRPVILLCWHGHDFVNLGIYHPVFGQDAPGFIMIRDNAAGRALARFAHRMRIGVVPLGTDPDSSQWARGVVTMLSQIKRGGYGLIAVDGPEGPPYQVKPGAAFLAQRSGAILVPCVPVASRGIRLTRRWDQHLIPLPGARLFLSFGPLIDAAPVDGVVPTVEELTQRVAIGLAEGARRAEAMARGLDPERRPSDA
jgi:lysophospholipid acyltransferase (LPLAT)-like uncharacterized protein